LNVCRRGCPCPYPRPFPFPAQALGDSCPLVLVQLVHRSIQILSPVNFVGGAAEVQPDSKEVVRQITVALKCITQVCQEHDLPALHFAIEGHVHPTGAALENKMKVTQCNAVHATYAKSMFKSMFAPATITRTRLAWLHRSNLLTSRNISTMLVCAGHACVGGARPLHRGQRRGGGRAMRGAAPVRPRRFPPARQVRALHTFSDCVLQTACFRLRTSDGVLQTAYFSLQATHASLPVMGCGVAVACRSAV
jgi:hypothetical protein